MDIGAVLCQNAKLLKLTKQAKPSKHVQHVKAYGCVSFIGVCGAYDLL